MLEPVHAVLNLCQIDHFNRVGGEPGRYGESVCEASAVQRIFRESERLNLNIDTLDG